MQCMNAQLCPTLCNPDCSPPGSSVHGISQARILKWVAISSSRGSSQPRDQTLISDIFCIGRQIFTTAPPGKHYGPIYQRVKHWLCVGGCVCVVKSIRLFFAEEGGLIFWVSSKNWQVWEISLINWSLWLVENWILLFESYGKLKILWSFSISVF